MFCVFFCVSGRNLAVNDVMLIFSSVLLMSLTWQRLVLLIMSRRTARVRWCANSLLCGCVTLIEKCMPLYAHMHVTTCPRVP